MFLSTRLVTGVGQNGFQIVCKEKPKCDCKYFTGDFKTELKKKKKEIKLKEEGEQTQTSQKHNRAPMLSSNHPDQNFINPGKRNQTA